MRLSAAVAAVLVPLGLSLLATPAQASPNCMMSGGPGLRISIHVGTGNYTEAEQAELDIIRLRRIGVIADTAERTHLGCLKVTRRDTRGHWITEYYDADTLAFKPLNSTGPLNLRLP